LLKYRVQKKLSILGNIHTRREFQDGGFPAIAGGPALKTSVNVIFSSYLLLKRKFKKNA